MTLNKEQKLFLFILSALTLSAAAVGGYQIYSTVYGPFQSGGPSLSISETRQELEKSAIRQMMSLHSKDTDTDGLSDFDELYTYNTSPYLADTDSDSVDDRSELAAGDDPLCYRGTDCSGQGAIGSLGEEVEGELSDVHVPPLEGVDVDSLSADDLRGLLEGSGFSKEQLNGFSDQQLLETWKSIISGQAP